MKLKQLYISFRSMQPDKQVKFLQSYRLERTNDLSKIIAKKRAKKKTKINMASLNPEQKAILKQLKLTPAGLRKLIEEQK